MCEMRGARRRRARARRSVRVNPIPNPDPNPNQAPGTECVSLWNVTLVPADVQPGLDTYSRAEKTGTEHVPRAEETRVGEMEGP